MELLQIGLGTLVLMMLLALVTSFAAAWNEAASSIESVVSTGALRPLHAVVLAAGLNGIGPFLFAPVIAALIATGLIDPVRVEPACLIAGLVTAIGFAAFGARIGLAPNTMHSALGGLIGASVAARGVEGLSPYGAWIPLVASVLAPLVALISAALVWIVLAHLLRRSSPRSTDRLARKAQWLSCGLFNLARGNQIAQTGLGLIWLALIMSGLVQSDETALGYVFTILVALTVGAGTLLGGLALIRRRRLSRARLRPAQASCAEGAAAVILAATSHAGIPVASPHLLTAAMLGASQSGRPSLKHWGINTAVLATAVLSLPAAAFAGAVIWRVTKALTG